MSQADWNLYIKSSKTSANAYQQMYAKKRKEEEDKKKKEIVFGDDTETDTTSSKAAAVEQGKSFWDGVGDFAKGVGTTVAEGVKGAGDFAIETVKGVKNLIDINAEQDKTGKYLEGQKAINDKYTQEENEKVWNGYENASSVDELPADRVKAWEDIQARRKADMESYDSTAVKGDMAKTNELFTEQARNEKAFKEAGQKTYKLAQYIPGVSLGVEGAGTVMSAVAGDDSDMNKALIELTQSKDWDKLSDEEKKQALIQRNLGGALSTLDLLPLGGKAAGVGIKTGIKEGAEAGFKAAGKEIAQSVGSKTIKEVASVGAKELAKQTVKSSVTGAVVGAGLGVGLNAVMGGKDWQQAAIEGAKSGFIGGFIGSPLDIDVKNVLKETGKNSLDIPDETIKSIIDDIDATTAKTADEAKYIASRKAEFEQIMANRQAGLADDGSKMINLEDNQRQLADMQSGRYTDDMYDITKSDGTPADPEFIKAATQKQVDLLTEKRDVIAQQVDAITDPAAREMAMQNVNKIDDQIASIKSGDTTALMETGAPGITRKLNTDKVRERFNQLQNERAEGNFRQDQAKAEAAKRTAPTRTFDEVSNEIDALGAGGVAPDAVTPLPDFTDVKEVAELDNMPMQLKGRATVLANDKLQLEMQRADIMTRAKADSTLDELDMNFNKKMSRIDMMPEPRRTAEMEKLQSEYEKSYADIEDQVARDADKATQLDRVEAQITANSNELLADANLIKDRNPAEFGIVHEEMNQKISQEIEQETETAIFNRMSNEEGVPDAENVSKAWLGATDEKIDQGLTSPQVSALASESISDTFTNDGVKIYGDNVRALNSTYTGLAMSSSSHNLEKIFGKTGTELFGKIVKGYAHVSKANEQVAKTLTQVKKAFGGDKVLYSKAVDVLEGKTVDLKDFNPAQVEAIGKIKELYDYGARQVRKLAYNDTVHNFEKRVANGDVKYTTNEIKTLAQRDGITIKDATAKYGNVSELSNSDINYLATKNAEGSTLDNYFPHMFDKDGKEIAFNESEYIKSSGNVNFGNMLHRLSNEDSYSRDIIDVSAKYFSGLNKKTYLEPALQELDNAKLAVKAATSDANPVWQWLDKYQGQLKYNKQDAIGKSWNEMVDKAISSMNPNSKKIGENHYRNLLSTQRQVNALAALGLSFRNAIQQTTQLGTTIGNIGVKDTTIGMVKYLKQRFNPATKEAYRSLLDEHGVTNAGIAREAYSELLSEGLSGITKSKGEKLSNGLMFMTSRMDEFARGSTYEGALTAKLREGMPRAQAESFATAEAAKYNFLTSKVDMPVALNGDTVRSLSQFMTFSYKQAEAWKDLGIKAVKNPTTGKFQLQPKQMSKLLQMVAFYGLAFEGMSQAAGINPEDNIPFYGNVFGDSGLPKSPLIGILFGQNETSPGLIEIAGGIVNPEGDNDFDKEENRTAMFEKLTDMMIRSFVPAGSQMSKSYKGYESTQNDGVVSKDGKVKFIQNTDEASKLKATLFGQYSTDAGREWINKQFPTLSEKQSEILNEQKTAEAKKRAYDFYAGLKSATTKSVVTPKIKDTITTQPEKAKRLIKEHNAQVKQAVDTYTAKYGELSEQEADYLAKNYFITYGTLENISDNLTEEE